MLPPKHYTRRVKQDTDVVIEGFPRSANTFLVHSLKITVKGRLCIAHHLHDPCQIIGARRWGILCFVIVRNPLDAVVSWKLKTPNIDSSLMLQIYISFYRYAIKNKNFIFFLRYTDVINNTQDVIELMLGIIGKDVGIDSVVVDKDRVFRSIEERKLSREDKQDNDFDLSIVRPMPAKKLFCEDILKDKIKSYYLFLIRYIKNWCALS